MTDTPPPENVSNNIEEMRLELRDLEDALVRQDPPLDPRTLRIAKAKIDKLQQQIAELEQNGQAPCQNRSE